MKILLLIPALLILSACGHGFQSIGIRSVEPELEEYVKDFEETYNIRVNYTVEFLYLREGVVGNCKIIGSKRSVQISPEFFEDYKNDYGTIHQLIFHELGHCSLLLDHNDNRNEAFQEVSIMSSRVFGLYDYYLDNLDYYIESLTDSRAIPLGYNGLEWSCKK